MNKTKKVAEAIILASALTFSPINSASQTKNPTAIMRRDTVPAGTARIIILKQDSAKVSDPSKGDWEREKVMGNLRRRLEKEINDSLDAFGIKIKSSPPRND